MDRGAALTHACMPLGPCLRTLCLAGAEDLSRERVHLCPLRNSSMPPHSKLAPTSCHCLIACCNSQEAGCLSDSECPSAFSQIVADPPTYLFKATAKLQASGQRSHALKMAVANAPTLKQQASSRQGSAHVKAAIRSSWPMRPISLSEGKLHCCSRLQRASARLTALQKMTTCRRTLCGTAFNFVGQPDCRLQSAVHQPGADRLK